MTIFFHHVGDEMSKRDIPRTIGDFGGAVREFGGESIVDWLDDLSPSDQSAFKEFVKPAYIAPFQIWGVPRGARAVFNRIADRDIFLLLDSPGGGGFHYAGNVIFKLTGDYPELSRQLWGEGRFPLIFFLRGKMIYFPWDEFLAYFKYEPNFDPRGRVFGVAKERLREAEATSDSEFYDFVIHRYG